MLRPTSTAIRVRGLQSGLRYDCLVGGNYGGEQVTF